MFKSKGVLVVLIASLLLSGGVGAYTLMQNKGNQKAFRESGFMIDGTEATEGGYAKYQFEEGTNLKVRYPDKLVFQDVESREVVTDSVAFLHYNSGSLEALSGGVIVDLNELKETGYLDYYNLAPESVLENQGNTYVIQSRDGSMYLQNFIWKIGEDKYLLVSEHIDVSFSDNQTRAYDKFIELKYYNEGILNILSDEDAYRTVSSNCIATISNGIKIDLATRTILSDDEVCLSLEQMVYNADDAIDVLAPIQAANAPQESDGKKEQVEIKVPTFEVIDGADGNNGDSGESGKNGITGTNGLSGVNGFDGANGTDGTAGNNGNSGTKGENGTSGQNGEHGYDGSDGYDGSNGVNGVNGTNGSAGMKGTDGTIGQNGQNGNEGTSGENGMEGQKGENGVGGAKGSSGNPGAIGNDGDDGTDGSAGTPGDAGAAGTSGSSGTSGRPGAAGAAGNKGADGADGVDGDDSADLPTDIDSPIVLPVFSLSELIVNTNTATAKIKVVDTEDCLADISTNPVVILYSNSDGKVVQKWEIEDMEPNGNDFELKFDGLLPDKEYRFVISSDYQVNGNIYNRNFFSKTFTTDAIGLAIQKEFVTADTIGLRVRAAAYSNLADNMTLMITDGEHAAEMVDSVDLSDAKSADGFITVAATYRNAKLLADQKYILYLTDLADAEGTPMTGNYAVTEITTLKKAPVLGEAMAVLNRRDGVFDLQLKSVQDENNGIQYYRYEIYPSNLVVPDASGELKIEGEPVTTLLSSTDKVVPLPIDGSVIQRNAAYRLRVVACFQNNESLVEYASPISDEFCMYGTNLPTMTFQRDDDATMHDRLVGNIIIDTKDKADLVVDASKPIRVAYKSTSTGTQYQYVACDNAANLTVNSDGLYTFAFDRNNLRANETYLITVYGYVDTKDIAGETSGVQEVIIGSCTTSTFAPAVMQAQLLSLAGQFGASLKMAPAVASQSIDYELSTLKAMKINLYNCKYDQIENNIPITTTTLTADAGTAESYNSSLKDSLLNGMELTTELFKQQNPSFTTNAITGDYTIEISLAWDYTEYENLFVIQDNISQGLYKQAELPEWNSDWAGNGVYARLIPNWSAEEAHRDPKFESNASEYVGLYVRTNTYDNSAKLAKTITYYVWEQATMPMDFKNDTFYSLDNLGKLITKVDLNVVNDIIPDYTFWFDETPLSRGSKFVVTYTIELNDGRSFPSCLFTGKEIPTEGNVIYSARMDAPYSEPTYGFMQYESVRSGSNVNLTYDYWLKALDPEAVNDYFISSSFSATANAIVKSGARTKLTMTGAVNGIATVKFKTTRYKSVYNEWVERIAFDQKLENNYTEADYAAQVSYTIEQQNSKNRTRISLSEAKADYIRRLAAVEVKIYSSVEKLNSDSDLLMDLMLPISYAGQTEADVYLPWSLLSQLDANNTYYVKAYALYDTGMSGFKLAETDAAASSTTLVAIELVNRVGNGSYLVTGSQDKKIIVGTENAQNSLFQLTKKALDKAVSFAFSSPLEATINGQIGFAANLYGARVTNIESQNVYTLKEIKSTAMVNNTADAMNYFTVSLNDMELTLDIYSGSVFDISTSQTRADVRFKLYGHENKLDEIKNKKLYVDVYYYKKEGTVDALTKIISENEQTSGILETYTVEYNPVTLDKLVNQYSFHIDNLKPNMKYAIRFYYLDEAGNRHYPIDIQDPGVSGEQKWYPFSTKTKVIIQESSAAYVSADNYTNKKLVVPYVINGGTTGYLIQYRIVKKVGDNYVEVMSSEALQTAGIISPSTVLTENMYARLDFTPGILKWQENETMVSYPFGSEDYYLAINPVTAQGVAVGDEKMISLYVKKPTRPSYAVIAKAEQNAISFRIAVSDPKRTIVNNRYLIVLKNTATGETVTSANVPVNPSSLSPVDFKVEGLSTNVTYELSVYAVVDLENRGGKLGVGEDELANLTVTKLKTVRVTTLDLDYSFGDVTVSAGANNTARINYVNSRNLQSKVKSVQYSVFYLDSAVTTSASYASDFNLSGTTDPYFELLHVFSEKGTYYIDVRYLDANGDEVTAPQNGYYFIKQ